MSGEHNYKVTDTEGRPSVFVYECQSGVMAHVQPVNLATLRAIQLKAADVHPYPDPTPYRQPEANAFSDAQMTRAEDNPEYVALCQQVDKERATWVDRTIFDYAVTFPKYPTKAALVAAFSDKLSDLRKIAVLPEDDYDAVLLHLVLTWNQPALDASGKLTTAGTEYARLIQLAIQTVALTPDEVTAGVRFFRPVVSERGAGKVAR